MQTRCCSPPDSWAGRCRGALFQSHVGQGSQRLLLVGHTVEVLGQHDVFERGEVGDQVELLEDEADFFRPGAVQILGGDAGHVFAIEPDLARGGTIQAADQVGESGLSGTGGAHDGQPLAGLNLKRNVIQRADDSATASAWAG